MRPLTAILAVLTGIAGWFYLFYSKAAAGLGGIEQRQSNVRRVRLRRINGFVMIVLAVMLYVGTYAADERTHPAVFLAAWLSVTLLLGLVVLLVLADVRLTLRLRERIGQKSRPRDLGPASGAGQAGEPEDASGARDPGTPNPTTPSDPRTPP